MVRKHREGRNAIDPKLEQPARDLLGHAIRGEWDEFASAVENIGEERFLECLSLCLRIAGYIAIDICGHQWPTVGDVRKSLSGWRMWN